MELYCAKGAILAIIALYFVIFCVNLYLIGNHLSYILYY
jgi:hypothetical protein